jgi:DNA processing protein
MDTITTLTTDNFPRALLHIPEPPDELQFVGQMPSPELKLLAIVGSRKYSSYGQRVVEHLIGGLKGYPVGIVSGLALGVDSIAHEEALKNNLYTLAVFGTGLDESVWYPPRNKGLARRIIESGGGLLSELPPLTRAAKWTFPKRNRIVVGLSQAVLLIEAAEQSGTLITARLTADYNRELMVVPGDIFSKNSRGVHQFLKLGATPVTEASDILDVLGIETDLVGEPARPPLSPEEEKVIALLHEPLHKDELVRKLDLPISAVSVLLMQMEMKDLLFVENGFYWAKL